MLPIEGILALNNTFMVRSIQLLTGTYQGIDDLEIRYGREFDRSVFLGGALSSDGTGGYDYVSTLYVQLHASAGTYSDEGVRTALDQFFHGN